MPKKKKNQFVVDKTKKFYTSDELDKLKVAPEFIKDKQAVEDRFLRGEVITKEELDTNYKLLVFSACINTLSNRGLRIIYFHDNGSYKIYEQEKANTD